MEEIERAHAHWDSLSPEEQRRIIAEAMEEQ